MVLPKPIGKAKRKLVLDDSDEQEEEEQPMSKSAKRAATRVVVLGLMGNEAHVKSHGLSSSARADRSSAIYLFQLSSSAR